MENSNKNTKSLKENNQSVPTCSKPNVSVLGDLASDLSLGIPANQKIKKWRPNHLRSIIRELYPERYNEFSKPECSMIYCVVRRVLHAYKFPPNSPPPEEILATMKTALRKNIDCLLLLKGKEETEIMECDKDLPVTTPSDIPAPVADLSTDNPTDQSPTVAVNSVSCPYKHLKTLVFTKSYPHRTDLISFLNLRPTQVQAPKATLNSVLDFIHLPHVSVSISLAHFELTRTNCHESQYSLIDQNFGYRSKTKPSDTKLRYKELPGKKVSFDSSFIIEFLNQMMTVISKSNTISERKKADSIASLDEFRRDLSLCTNEISSRTEYYAPLSKTSYVRYLGMNKDSPQYIISSQDQLQTNSGRNSMKLQELIKPVGMFELKKFSVGYSMSDDSSVSFIINERLVEKSNWLVFSCTLCNVQFAGFLATYEMIQHLNTEHGTEPDWFCTSCYKTFTSQYLSNSRWQHKC